MGPGGARGGALGLKRALALEMEPGDDWQVPPTLGLITPPFQPGLIAQTKRNEAKTNAGEPARGAQSAARVGRFTRFVFD